MPAMIDPTAIFLEVLRTDFSVEAIEDGATMADIDDATAWAVELWEPDERTPRTMPAWCVLASP